MATLGASASPAWADAAAGLTWLREHQSAEGAWSQDTGLASRDSAEGARTFSDVQATDPTFLRAVDALRSLNSDTIDLQARRLIGLRLAVPEVILESDLQALASAALAGGGWSFDRQGRQADPLDTALALRALVTTRFLSSTVLLAGLAQLQAAQSPEGGFSQAQGEAPDVATTAEVLAALGAIGVVRDVTLLRTRAASFLVGSMNADGGFPGFRGDVSDPTMTALAMSALLETGSDVSALGPARDYLRAAQQTNGSWADDAYTTALAVRVIGGEKADLAVQAIAPSSASVQQGTPVTVEVQVRNLGLAPSTPTALSLFNGDPNAMGAGLGTTTMPALAVGQLFTHTFTVQTGGLSGTVALFAVADPAGLVPEYAETNNRRIALLVVRPLGVLPDPSTNQAPIITNIAPSTAVSGTLYSHAVDAIDPEGEPLQYRLLFHTAAASPQGMVMDASTGVLTWTAGAPGVYAFVIRVLDPSGASAVQTVNLQVLAPGEKRPPVFESFPLTAAAPGVLYAYHVNARDPDGGSVTVRLSSAPAGMTFDPTTSTVRWTPAANQVGEHLVRLVATDDENTSTDQSWRVIVDGGPTTSIDLVAMAVDPSLRRIDRQSLAVAGTALATVANQGTAAVEYEWWDDCRPVNHLNIVVRVSPPQIYLMTQIAGTAATRRTITFGTGMILAHEMGHVEDIEGWAKPFLLNQPNSLGVRLILSLLLAGHMETNAESREREAMYQLQNWFKSHPDWN